MLLALLLLGGIGAEKLCENGHQPLLDENGTIFNCDRGCPEMFVCENSERCCLTDLQHSDIAAQYDRKSKCEPLPLNMLCNGSLAQPVIRWYFDIQSLKCQQYPVGICGDEELDEIGLKSSTECEQVCDAQNLARALGDVNEIIDEQLLTPVVTSEPLLVTEGSGDEDFQFYEEQRRLVKCQSTPYRNRCQNGELAQFVYRWQFVDGSCQSFPYGYCWKEFNAEHPRTKAECEIYCRDSSKLTRY